MVPAAGDKLLFSHSQTLGKVNLCITYGKGAPPLLPSFASPCRLSSSGLGCYAWTVTKILCTVFTRRGVKAGAWLYSNHMGPQPCLHKRARAKTDDPVAWGPDYKHNPSKSRASGLFLGYTTQKQHGGASLPREAYLLGWVRDVCTGREGAAAIWLSSGCAGEHLQVRHQCVPGPMWSSPLTTIFLRCSSLP